MDRSESTFYTRVGGVVYGPYSLAKMQEFLDEKRIIFESEISLDQKHWFRAGEFSPFFSQLVGHKEAFALEPRRSLLGYFIQCWKKLFLTRGRARRREYIGWMLGHTLMMIIFLLIVFACPDFQTFTTNLQNKIAESKTSVLTEDQFQEIRAELLVVIDRKNNIYYFLPLLFYSFAALFPWYAVTVRRLHDLDFSGWFFCLIFSLRFIANIFYLVSVLVLMVSSGTKGVNRFGIDPKMNQ